VSKRFLAWLFAVSAVLRLAFVWVAPAWYDENFSLILSRLPLGQMLAATAGDVHPPLYYLLIWPLGQLHAPIWALRIPGALLSLASVWLFWRILQAFELRPHVQAAALVLMAIMPIQLYYAQEARMYSLLEFLVLAACLAMLRRRWAWFGLACGLMLYTQYYAIFYIAALGLVALIRARWIEKYPFGPDYPLGFAVSIEEYRKFFLSLALAGLAFLPWVIVLQNQMHTLSGNYWMQLTGVGMLPRVLFEILFMPPGNAVTQIPLMLACFTWVVGALLYASLHRPNNLGSIVWLAFLPFALAILVSLVWQPVLHYRPLIGISPFLYILLALPVEALFEFTITYKFKFFRSIFGGSDWSGKHRPYGIQRLDKRAIEPNLRKSLMAAIFLVPLLLVTDGSMYVYARQNKTSGATRAVAYIQAHWQPGDIVYHYGDDSWVNTVPYNDLPNYKAPDCAPTLGGLSAATRAAIGMQIRPLSALTYRRAWLLWSDGPLEPTCDMAQLTSLGLDPHKPILPLTVDEYYFEGLWLLEGK
jgi:hypothetical protein